jgi:nucleoside-diphosphate-sugar epimerase
MEVWRGIAEGLDAVIVNPSIILGAGSEDNASTAIFMKVWEGFNWYSEGVNGFVDVRDLARAMIALMESDISAERFVISAENRSYKDIFFQIADAFGCKRPSRKVNSSLANMVCDLERIRSFFSGKAPLVTRESVATALAQVYFDNSKLKNHLPGFHYTTMEDTISHTCLALQQKLNK